MQLWAALQCSGWMGDRQLTFRVVDNGGVVVTIGHPDLCTGYLGPGLLPNTVKTSSGW